jgi:hypothetical protein
LAGGWPAGALTTWAVAARGWRRHGHGVLGAEVAAWLGVAPGSVLTGAWFGGDAVPPALVGGLVVAAFLFLPLSITAAFAHDLQAQQSAVQRARQPRA